MARNDKKFLRVLSGVSLAVVLGGAVACIVPESRNYILDNLAVKSNVYQLKEEENKNLSLENDIKLNLINYLNEELKLKRVELEETKALLNSVNLQLEEKQSRIEELESLLNDTNISFELKDEEILQLTQEKTALQAEIETLNAEKAELQRQIDLLQEQMDKLSENGVTYKFNYCTYLVYTPNGSTSTSSSYSSLSKILNGKVYQNGSGDYEINKKSSDVISMVNRFSTMTKISFTEYSRYEILINNEIYKQDVKYIDTITYSSFDNLTIEYLINGQVYSEDLLDDSKKYCIALEHIVEGNVLTNIRFHILTAEYIETLKCTI